MYWSFFFYDLSIWQHHQPCWGIRSKMLFILKWRWNMQFDIKHMYTKYIWQLPGAPKIKLCMCKSVIPVMFPGWALEWLVGFPAVAQSFEPETPREMLKHMVAKVFAAQQSSKTHVSILTWVSLNPRLWIPVCNSVQIRAWFWKEPEILSVHLGT